jgi:murein DD-endopeptidase MepM/ murein hydrolase activator NlpD
MILALAAACGPPPRPAESPPPIVHLPAPSEPRTDPSRVDAVPPAAEPEAIGARTPADSARDALAGRRLLVPVSGVEVARILDSFTASRGARMHNALDIMAPRGTPVVSADDGTVLRVSENRAGGLTVYTADPDRRLVYYYAHMDRYAKGIAAGRPIARGDTIGFVGTTGNAPRDIPHLHFQMMLMHPEGRYWAGTPVNPLPFLLAAAGDSDEPDE